MNTANNAEGLLEARLSCPICKTCFDRQESLEVHLRWQDCRHNAGMQQIDTENNNHQLIKPSLSPVSVAADSSGDQNINNPEFIPYHQQNYGSYFVQYDYAQQPPQPLQHPQHPEQQQQQPQLLEFKTVPSPHYAYNNSYNSSNGMSPHTEGSPLVYGEDTSPGNVPTSQLTPSPSPNCDKCSLKFATSDELAAHKSTMHECHFYGQPQYTMPKEDPEKRIYDLDQKTVCRQVNNISLPGIQRHQLWPAQYPQFPYGSLTPPIRAEYGQRQENLRQDTELSPEVMPSATTMGTGTLRKFEAPTSSQTGKATAWKSNEPRRPKTYHCTACNKWFTSSGHLKRHYNTTLHKNAVKSSGSTDPALLPISHHHHPQRDPNYSGKARRSQQALQNTGQPPDPPNSDFQYAPIATPQFSNSNFVQYNSQQINGGPPNGVAGPSVLASQPRDLQQQYSLTTDHQLQQQQQQQQQQVSYLKQEILEVQQPEYQFQIAQVQQGMQQEHQPITISISHHIPDSQQIVNTMETYNQHYPMLMDTNITNIQSFPHTQYPEQISGEMYSPIGSDIDSPGEDFLTGSYPNSPDLPTPCSLGESRVPTPMQVDPPAESPTSTVNIQQTKTKKSQKSIQQTKANKSLKCTMCRKVLTDTCYLTQHIKSVHNGEKTYRCEICGKRFLTEVEATEHVKKHKGEKSHKCPECDKTFNHKTDLNRHAYSHSGTKPFQCHICSKGFIRNDHMLKHAETHTKKALQAQKKAAARNNKLKNTKQMEIFSGESDISNSSSKII